MLAPVTPEAVKFVTSTPLTSSEKVTVKVNVSAFVVSSTGDVRTIDSMLGATASRSNVLEMVSVSVEPPSPLLLFTLRLTGADGSVPLSEPDGSEKLNV